MGTNKSRSEARLRRHRRVRKNIAGTPEKPRLNVFRSLAEIYAQVIDDETGRTLVSASSVDRQLRGTLKGKKKSEQAHLERPWQNARREKASRKLSSTGAVTAILAGLKPLQMAPAKAEWSFSRGLKPAARRSI